MGQHLLNTRIFRGLCECGRQGSAHMEEEVEVRSISIISLVSSKIEQLKAILIVSRQGCLQTTGTGENEYLADSWYLVSRKFI